VYDSLDQKRETTSSIVTCLLPRNGKKGRLRIQRCLKEEQKRRGKNGNRSGRKGRVQGLKEKVIRRKKMYPMTGVEAGSLEKRDEGSENFGMRGSMSKMLIGTLQRSMK